MVPHLSLPPPPHTSMRPLPSRLQVGGLDRMRNRILTHGDWRLEQLMAGAALAGGYFTWFHFQPPKEKVQHPGAITPPTPPH